MDNEHHHVLITGGCGFLGRAIVDAFLEQYPTHLYTILGLSPPLLSRQNVGFIQADIRDPAAVERALSASRPDAVVHAAGIVPTGQSRYSQREREHVFAVNVEGTRNLLSVAKSVGSVRAFVYTSSSTVVGDDLSSGDRPNAREEVEDVGRKRWIYGESKVIFSVASTFFFILEPGKFARQNFVLFSNFLWKSAHTSHTILIFWIDYLIRI